MKEFIYGLSQYPDGVKLCFCLLIITAVICIIAVVHISIREYKEDHLQDEYWMRRKDRK